VSINGELVQSQTEGYNEHTIFCGAGFMVALKCPKCGKSAELPDGLAGGEHRCYSCNVYLQYADPSLIPKQEKEFKDQAYASILGAMLGACSILSIEVVGDKVGLAIAAGLAGALVGCLSGFINGLFDGLGWSTFMWDGSWFTFIVKMNMILGAIFGLLAAMFGELNDWSRDGVLALGVLAGFILGGLLGALFARQKERTKNRSVA